MMEGKLKVVGIDLETAWLPKCNFSGAVRSLKCTQLLKVPSLRTFAWAQAPMSAVGLTSER